MTNKNKSGVFVVVVVHTIFFYLHVIETSFLKMWVGPKKGTFCVFLLL